ncbi:hypothetical protein [Rudaeicoccus suwonensis]|nr:hypothetical protein [Rudaeicoccus suwonensis]
MSHIRSSRAEHPDEHDAATRSGAGQPHNSCCGIVARAILDARS